jgi:hypothetical protein
MSSQCNFGSQEIWESIKRFDSALELEWNPEINRWELYRKSRGKLHYILKLETPDGKPCGVDMRLKRILAESDNWKYKDAVTWAREINQRERNKKAKAKADLHDKIVWTVKDTAKTVARRLGI